MDTLIAQLFSIEDIIGRLAQRKMTGQLKVSAAANSASIFFKKGMIVAAEKGEAQGETALKQILDWKDTTAAWEADVPAPVPPLKPVLINFESFLKKQGALSKTSGMAPPGGKSGASVTKSISATGETRTANDAALLTKYKFTLVSMANKAHKFKLTKATCVIGRNPSCDISIPDTSISRQHCILQITDRGLFVKDLNTVNGTKINGIPMKEGYVNTGDKMIVGNIGFILEESED